MSKPVRIRGDVAARVEERASSERRSFANMVEVLLLEALAGLTERGVPVPPTDSGNPVRDAVVERPRSVSPADVAATIPGVTVVRPHMRRDRPAVQCPERVGPGETCGVCGAAL